MGLFYTASSTFLFEAYKYIASGLATTLVFLFPAMVAIIMVFLKVVPSWPRYFSLLCCFLTCRDPSSEPCSKLQDLLQETDTADGLRLPPPCFTIEEVLFSIPDIMEWRYGKPHIKTWSSDYPNERSSRSFSMKGAEWRKKRR